MMDTVMPDLIRHPEFYFARMKSYYLYILANKPNGTLYIGVTNDLHRRIDEHREGLAEGFTKRYNVKRLVYFEETNNVQDAIAREKQLKNWHRAWKIDLIEKENPDWQDLWGTILDAGSSPA